AKRNNPDVIYYNTINFCVYYNNYYLEFDFHGIYDFNNANYY
ncbi:unnamed protein product, partial [marine sediment metagenome]